MINIKEWMELVEYRLTEGDNYLWQCFGDKAYSLSSWNGDHDGHSFNIVFDSNTQVVYTVEACDFKNQRAYRMINPDYKAAHDDEALDRKVDPKQAWDDVSYVDLETDDDFIQKAMAIRAGEDYDTRVEVPLDLDETVLFELMKVAHRQDITLNQLIERIIRDAIDQAEMLNDWTDAGPLDSQYPDGDGYWVEDGNKSKKKKKKKKNDD